jgi:hypothetical protein
MTRSKFLSRCALVFCATLLLMLGFGTPKAHADEFAAGNAALLDPFDPVPQIRFSDCYNDCGYRRDCYDGCWRPRRHHIHRSPPLVLDERSWCERMVQYDYNTHRWDGSMARYDDQADQYDDFMKNRYPLSWHKTHHPAPGPFTGDLHAPCLFLHGGPRAQFADYEWRQDGGHWRYWHDNDWHDDGFDGRWHDGHR